MASRLLFVMDPIEHILPDKDTTFVFMLESQRRHHDVYYCLIGDLFAANGVPRARARRARVTRGSPHFQLFEERTEDLVWFHAILVRKDPPFDLPYLFATQILSLTPPSTFIMNSPHGLREANEKLYTLNFPDLMPPTLVTRDLVRLKAFLDELGGEMIIKPLDGCGGAGIFHVRRDDRNLNVLLEMSTDNGRRLILAQRYLPQIREGDKRVIVLDGHAIGATLRVPRDDEHRGNIHVGGTCIRSELTARDHSLAAAIGPRLRRDGLFFVGLDVIGGYLTEVNVTSPTGVQEIDALSGVSLEALVLDFVEQRIGAVTRRPT